MITKVALRPQTEEFVQWDGTNDGEIGEFVTVSNFTFTNNGDQTATLVIPWVGYEIRRDIAVGHWVDKNGATFTPDEFNARYYRPDFPPADPNA